LTYIRDRLENQTEPESVALCKEIAQITQQDAMSTKRRATSALVTVFGRLLHQYFEKWRQGATTKRVQLDSDFKVKLIKLYRAKLSRAFNVWRVNRSAMVIEMQTLEFEEIQN